MRRKYCDRCGEEIAEASGAQNIAPRYTIYDNFKSTKEGFFSPPEIDLCSKCTVDFEKFMKGGAKV